MSLRCVWVISLACGFLATPRVAETATVRGAVADLKGRPVWGVPVIVNQLVKRPNTRKKQTTVTGNDGTFSFSVLPKEMVGVFCQGPPGWRVRVPNRWVAPDGEVLRFVARKETGDEADFAPLRKKVIIRGALADPQGKPLAGAPVVGRGALQGARTTSAKDGTFELRHVVTAQWTYSWLTMVLYVDVPERRLGRRHRVTFNERWEYDVPLRLVHYRSAEGVVTDGEGNPISGVSVLRRNHALRLEWKPVGTTDERGRFAVDDLIPGVHYSFCALSEKSGTPRANCVYWTEGDLLAPIRSLVRDRVVEGVAVDRDGRRVAGALVTLEPCLGERSKVRTGADGGFRFTGLIRGEVTIRARAEHPRHPGGLAGTLVCPAGAKGVRLVLVPQGCRV